MFKYVVFGLLVASAIATPAPSSGLDCDHAEDALTCLAVKASATLERAARSADINLIDGVTLVRDTPVFSHSPSKKHKKLLTPLLTLIGVKLFALAPIFLGGLALFVTKAIFLSKVAILIAGVLLFQKFFGAGSQIAFPGGLFGKNNVAPQYNYEPATYAQAGAFTGYQRSLDAQQLAYSAQAPAQ
ncbi:unnamed protein product [Trichogramma brassicae]|uniref:Uncharacterized protein n=1 Tax=Trichogramma brassicae TaxID=86971 RepID=A0A6H5J2E8_9HYME|nr:unnamed protein product [Trichogramma brassicae]